MNPLKCAFTRLPALALGGSLLALLLAGCESTPASSNDAAATPVAGTPALPLTVLDAVYASRTAMAELADGSAEDPATAVQIVRSALPIYQQFAAQLTALQRSFNSADSTQLWDQLAQMGSFYRFNTSALSASDLRNFEASQMRGFRDNVADLNRQFTTYLEAYEQFLGVVGPEFSMAEVQTHIPMVNQLTLLTVGLDEELRRFSEALTNLSSLLQQFSFQGRM